MTDEDREVIESAQERVDAWFRDKGLPEPDDLRYASRTALEEADEIEHVEGARYLIDGEEFRVGRAMRRYADAKASTAAVDDEDEPTSADQARRRARKRAIERRYDSW